MQQARPHSPEIDNKKMLIGVLIVIGIAISWVGSTQFAKSTFSADFSAPFLITWFSTSWMSAVFPLYFLPSLLRGIRIRSFYRYAQRENKIYLHTYTSFIKRHCLLACPDAYYSSTILKCVVLLKPTQNANLIFYTKLPKIDI